jgi:hypothetical protein
MTHRLLAMAIALAGGLLLAGCGDDSTSPTQMSCTTA